MSSTRQNITRLAIKGGQAAVDNKEITANLFTWPIVTEEDEHAVLEVMRSGKMSQTDITKKFELEYAAWVGSKYALGTCNGTAALHAAMWACGVGARDEIICPSITYWASAAPALQLGATVNFADSDPLTLGIDPEDIEHRIGPRTRAIVVVHLYGHPCDMDPIMAIARRHKLKVIEDTSHAHGSLYKGRHCGTIGDVGCMSMMAGKSFALGEGGMLTTNSNEIYQRLIAFGHYERTGAPSRYNLAEKNITLGELTPYIGLPLGGTKHRMNQTVSAMGRVQLRHYPDRIREIQKAMNYFWDLLEDIPGMHAIRTTPGCDSTMGGWYAAAARYEAAELGGLPLEIFCEAVRAEGIENCTPGVNAPLHLHPYFHQADIFHMGKPTAIAFGQRDVRQGKGTLPVAESTNERALFIPWFKHHVPEDIERYANAYRKVALRADELMNG